MQFIENDGLIFIPITLGYNSKSYQITDCILDTGSAGTVIDVDLIPFNPKIPGILKRLHGLYGHQDVVAQSVYFIQIENCRLENILVEFGDIKNSYGIKGILGTNLLRFLNLYLNFNQRNYSALKSISPHPRSQAPALIVISQKSSKVGWVE